MCSTLKAKDECEACFGSDVDRGVRAWDFEEKGRLGTQNADAASTALGGDNVELSEKEHFSANPNPNININTPPLQRRLS